MVVGLDSEQSNTAGAIERCRKVEKAHRGSELRRSEKPLGTGLCGVDERGEQVIAFYLNMFVLLLLS